MDQKRSPAALISSQPKLHGIANDVLHPFELLLGDCSTGLWQNRMHASGRVMFSETAPGPQLSRNGADTSQPVPDGSRSQTGSAPMCILRSVAWPPDWPTRLTTAPMPTLTRRMRQRRERGWSTFWSFQSRKLHSFRARPSTMGVISLMMRARSFWGSVTYHFDSRTLPCRDSSRNHRTACRCHPTHSPSCAPLPRCILQQAEAKALSTDAWLFPDPPPPPPPHHIYKHPPTYHHPTCGAGRGAAKGSLSKTTACSAAREALLQTAASLTK